MRLRIIILLILSFTLTTCQKDHLLDCFKSAGETTIESREVSPFAYIDLTDNVDLVINPDTDFYIKVTAGSNLIDGIITELNGNTLYIRNENRCNWMRSFSNIYTVEIGMRDPVEIHYDGSGNISCSDSILSDDFTFDCFGGSGTINFLFRANRIHLNNHIGRSDIHAAGSVNDCETYINDVGVLDAENLVSKNCYIRSNSTGDCRINVKDEMGFEILYVGNIYYTGNPTIYHTQIEGSGQLYHY